MITSVVMVYICIFHLREGTSWIPRYTYDSFWCCMGMMWFLYVTLAVCNSLFNTYLVHFEFVRAPCDCTFRYSKVHTCSFIIFIYFFSYDCIDVSLLVMVARSCTYVIEPTANLDMPKVYPQFPFCSHLSSGSRNMIKSYGLRVSPCIIPLCIGISFVWPKYSLVHIVFVM